MRTIFKLSVAALSVALGILASSPARAGYTLTISDAGGSVTLTDNGTTSPAVSSSGSVSVTSASAPVPGSLVFVGRVGSVKLNVDTGTQSPFPPSGTSTSLDLNYNATGTTAPPSTVTISLSQTGFSWGAATNANFNLFGGGTNTSSSSTATALLNGSPILSFGPTSSAAFSFNNSTSAGITNPFSLTLQESITLTAKGGQATGDNTLNGSVPEPCTLAILATGLPLMGFGALRRRKKATIA